MSPPTLRAITRSIAGPVVLVIASLGIAGPATAQSEPLRKGYRYEFTNAVTCYSAEAADSLIRLAQAGSESLPTGCVLGRLSDFIFGSKTKELAFRMRVGGQWREATFLVGNAWDGVKYVPAFVLAPADIRTEP